VRRALGVLLLVLLQVVGLSAAARGQSASSPQSSASAVYAVVAQSLQGIAVRHLHWGTLLPGTSQTVARSDAQTAPCLDCTSGKWQVGPLSDNNVEAKFIVLTFTRLRTQLAGYDGATLPVAYTASACLVQSGVTYHCFPEWTPVEGTSYSFRNRKGNGNTDRYLEVFLGGTATAAADQAAGPYLETVTLSFTYSRT
jgi:hypothetical protein